MFEEAIVSDDGQELFDESSDEDVRISSCTDDSNSQGQKDHDELGTSTNFPFSVTSRYERAVTFNKFRKRCKKLNSDNRHAVCPTKSYATKDLKKEKPKAPAELGSITSRCFGK